MLICADNMDYRILVLWLFFLHSQVILLESADTNRIKSLNVKCGDQDMLVDIEFNTPFNGIIFSKGYFARSECVQVKAAAAKYTYQFTIAYSGCGTTAGGSGIPSGTRRSDGFLRSSDEVLIDRNVTTTNSSRSRRDLPAGNVTVQAQGRSLGGWGGPGGSMAGEGFGDPLAPQMQNQDLSAGGGAGYGDPMAPNQVAGLNGGGGYGASMAPNQMGNAGAGYGGGNQMAAAGGQMGNQYYQPGAGGGNSAYSSGLPIYNGYGGNNANPVYNGYSSGGGGYSGGSNGGGYNHGGQQQSAVYNANGGNQQNNGGVVWNGNNNIAGSSVQDNSQNNAASQGNTGNVAVVGQSNQATNSQSAAGSFAASIPGSPSGQSQGESDDVEAAEAGLKTNQPISEDRTGGTSRFFENIIIIQYDANIQEVWDVAKALRCEWHDNYHKTVSYKPFQVDALEVVPATFAGDNVGVWVTVQQGKGPYAPEVNGIVRIGEYLTLAIGIQDKTKKFDMRVINCFASDGVRPAIQLVDEYGCVTRPKIMSDFAKVVNYGDQASVVSYAYFQAFKFPDSVDVHLECSVEICKFGCAKQCYNKLPGGSAGSGSKVGSAITSVSSGMSFGGSSSAARDQLSRKVDSGVPLSDTPASGVKASVGGSASSSSSSKGQIAVKSGKATATSSNSGGAAAISIPKVGSAVASSGNIEMAADANEDSVNDALKKSLKNGKIAVKIESGTKSPLRGTAAPGGSQGQVLSNGMAAADEANDDLSSTETTKKGKTKKLLKATADDDEERAYRRRREAASPATLQNVGIKRTIRVVAPGDLSFFDSNRNNTVVYSSAQRIVGQSDVCISPTSFVVGIVVLVALLILTTLAALILCLRLRSLDRVSNKHKQIDLEYIKNTM